MDTGVTKGAHFVKKARVIEICGHYSATNDVGVVESLEQIHMMGFDTPLRLLDTKYHPPATL